MSLHHAIGAPEVGPLTADEEAFAAAVLSDMVAAQEPTKSVNDWSAAAAFYWAQAYAALEDRDFRLMRVAATQATEADELVSPNGNLLLAIFANGKMPPAPERPVRIGRTLPMELIPPARKAVRAEIARFNKQRKQR